MKTIKFLHALLIGLLTAALVGVPVANFLDINPLIPVASFMALPFVVKVGVTMWYGFTPKQTNFAYMSVQKENWVDYIMQNLFKDNEFLNYCYNESDSVLEGTVVHIPQAGAKPTVRKNRTQFPGVAVQRADTDVTYPLDWYTTDPSVITNAEEKEVSYDKIDSVLGEHVPSINDSIAEDILYKWAAVLATNILRTSGVADNVALAPGSTGTRKAFKFADLRAAQAQMNKAGVSKKDRYALLPEDMLTQLLADTTLTSIQVQALMDLKEGTITRLAGFTILTRANACMYDNSGTPIPKLITAATATTDNLSVLCWEKNSVAKALGTVDFFENKQDATFYGDVYSAGVRCGGRIRRATSAGVISIVQTP